MVYNFIFNYDYFNKCTVFQMSMKGYESNTFLNLFRKITITFGDLKCTFSHWNYATNKTRLFMVNGERKHRVIRQLELNSDNLHQMNSFVLDCGHTIYQFNGCRASVWSKRNADKLIEELKSDRCGKVKCTKIINGLKDNDTDLWKHFGEKPNQIQSEKRIAKRIYELSLHKLCFDGGTVSEIKQVSLGKMNKSQLQSDGMFILDSGHSVCVWIGNKEKRNKCEVLWYIKRGTVYVARIYRV